MCAATDHIDILDYQLTLYYASFWRDESTDLTS